MFWKDHPEVSGLASTKNNLDKCHVCLQALMDLLDCGVFGLDRMLGQLGDPKLLNNVTEQCGG